MCFLAQMSLCRLLAPCVVLAIPGWLLLLLIPSVEREVFRFSHTHLVGDALAVANAVITARHFVFCMGDYLWCVKDLIIDDLVSVYGWDAGVGVGSIPSMGVSEAPVYFSHAQYSSVAYDPRAGRPMDALCLTNRSDLPLGILPDRDPILMLNCDTGSQEHIAPRTGGRGCRWPQPLQRSLRRRYNSALIRAGKLGGGARQGLRRRPPARF